MSYMICCCSSEVGLNKFRTWQASDDVYFYDIVTCKTLEVKERVLSSSPDCMLVKKNDQKEKSS